LKIRDIFHDCKNFCLFPSGGQRYECYSTVTDYREVTLVLVTLNYLIIRQGKKREHVDAMVYCSLKAIVL
jgi:hypothetical protein